MPMEIQRILRDWFKIGVLTGLLASVIALLINWLKVPLVNVTFSAVDVNVRQQLQAGTATGAGAKILGWLSGVTGLTLPNFLYGLVGALVAVYIGRILVEWLTFLKGKTPVSRMTSVLFTGSIVSGLIAAWAFSIPPVGMLAAMLLYSLIISLVLWGLSTRFDMFKIPE